MKTLVQEEKEIAERYFLKAAEIAKSSTCLRDRCGSIIVSNNEIIGIGFNSPPGNLETQRRCQEDKNSYDEKIKDTTCCIHAEQRAIIQAVSKSTEKIKGARIYFTRIDEDNNLLMSGQPYCTHCSKLALDVGLSEFALWHEKGIVIYTTQEYNLLSFEYKY